jgi:hypothetical protein
MPKTNIKTTTKTKVIDYEQYKRRPLSSNSRGSDKPMEYNTSAKVRIKTQLEMIPLEFDIDHQDIKHKLREILSKGMQKVQRTQRQKCELKQADLEVRVNVNNK